MDEPNRAVETIGHHRRIILKSLSHLIPPVAVLVELWTSYVPTLRERRQVEAFEELARRVDELATDVDSSRILNEPYGDLFEDVMATVATRRGTEKRDYYVSVLVNGIRTDAPEWDRQERMLACLDDLRPSHLRLLALVVRDLTDNPGTSTSVVGRRTGFLLALPDGADADLVDRDWRDMVGWGIFMGLENHGVLRPPAPTTAVEFQGGAAFFKGTILPFGLEFAEFVGAAEMAPSTGDA